MRDVEDRIAQALQRLPDPDRNVSDAARRNVIASVPARPAVRRRVWSVLLPAAVGAAGAAIAIGIVGFGLRDDEPAINVSAPAPAGELRLPEQPDGIAVLADGRAWSRTRQGLSIEGLGASALELSPNALYLAAGIGRSLTALTPSGSRVWSLPTRGPVVAASWAPNPNPIYVAYVVDVGNRRELRMVEGDGDNDRLIVSSVGPDRPVWRGDSLRLWFSRSDGTQAGYDLTTRRVLGAREVVDAPRTASLDSAAEAAKRARPGARLLGAASTARGSAVAVAPPPEAGPANTPAFEVWWVSPDPNDAPVLVLAVPGRTPRAVQLAVR